MSFDTTGITVGPDGIKRYDGLPPTLVHLLRETVTRHPDVEAVAEIGGQRHINNCGLETQAALRTYQQLRP